MKNKHLIAAYKDACAKENISPSAKADKIEGLSRGQVSKFPCLGLRDDALAAITDEKNWSDPSSAMAIAVAHLNDEIVRMNKSPEAFEIGISGKTGNVGLESAISVIEHFARNSNGAEAFIKQMAAMIIQLKKAGAKDDAREKKQAVTIRKKNGKRKV